MNFRASFQFSILVLLLFPLQIYSAEIIGNVEVIMKNSDSGSFEPAKSHKNVVVYLTGVETKAGKSKDKAVILQKNKKFEPRVVAILVGGTVEFKNEDDHLHNVWSLSKTKPFDLGVIASPEAKSVQFDRPGLVKIFCDIHPEMIGSILVLKNRHFQVTSDDGRYHLKDLPEGNYKLRVWGEGIKPQSKSVQLKKDSKLQLNFTAKIKLRSVKHLNKNGKPYKQY